MRHRYPFLLAVLLTLFLAACGGQGAGDVSGTWNATATSTTGQTLAFTLQLTQTGTTLSGNFVIQGESAPMTGTSTGSLVSLSTQGSEIRIEASVNGNSMQGTLAVTGAQGTGSAPFTATK